MSWTSGAQKEHGGGHGWAEGKGRRGERSNELPNAKREVFKTTAITQQLGMKATSSGTNYTFLN